MKILVFWVFAFVCNVAWALPEESGKLCVKYFGVDSQNLRVEEGLVKVRTDKWTFEVTANRESYLFRGTLENGALSITAVLAHPERGVRSHLNGRDLYDQMIHHFGVENIQTIHGEWFSDTNHGQFFNFVKSGMSREEAAANTWSGQQAARHGFSHVARAHVYFSYLVNDDVVKAEFTRPPAATAPLPKYPTLENQTLRIVQGVVKRELEPDKFNVSVPQYDFGFRAFLGSGGMLSISARLADTERGIRSHLKGNELYDQMITHFGVDKIKVITGVWVDETNIEQFLEYRRRGLSESMAALHTWSGQQAQRHGFTRVQKVLVGKQPLTGAPEVYVEFVKP